MIKRLAGSAVLVAALAFAAAPASAKCFKKYTEGTAGDEAGAKFQAFEAVLQSFDWGVWATYMSTGATPGYKISTTYKCKNGGLGKVCNAAANVCTAS